ncbi:hypothetical protein SEPCBS119000_001209 [Sporothrix epigloea]|uniref:Pinin/SDK/MemA protein domain-containing protein n=1 Tax=Sporothrix epigloea TaxID=1892477 RepID=A0ABP0D9D4_9PEZI
MYALHAKELVLAQSLHTRSKPMLHYRPRKLTKAQEREIEDQVRSSSKRRIKKEIESFEKEKQTRLSALGLQSISAINVSKPSRSTTTFVRS